MKPKRILGGGITGLSRLDVMVLLGLLAVLIVLGLVGMQQYKIRSARAACVNNLLQIGWAMAMYSQDNDSRLPYAGLRPLASVHISWDDLINKQLGGKLSVNQIRSATPTNDMPVLRCPSDRVPASARTEAARGHRRSYAMPSHAMTDANWPPGPNNRTGIGLLWDLGTNGILPASVQKWQPAKGTNTVKQEAFTTAMIPKPAKTIAITERISGNNVIGNIGACTIPSTDHHIDPKVGSVSSYHAGKFSYLFVDAHAEAMRPAQTLDAANKNPAVQSGMWLVGGSK